jgi:hypothetical protein
VPFESVKGMPDKKEAWGRGRDADEDEEEEDIDETVNPCFIYANIMTDR